MKLKLLLILFSGVFLNACGKSATDLNSIQPAVSSKGSFTAVFFPGGGGIDFVMLPAFESSGVDINNKPFKSLYYDFVGRKQGEVDKAIDNILINQGYTKVEIAAPVGVDKYYLYQKAGVNMMAVWYSKEVKEGFKYITRTYFWWNQE